MNREQDILDAAEKLFHERSFDGTGVDAIAREAGLSGSGVYRHFASKEEILAGLAERATDALVAGLPTPGSAPHDELRLLIAAHVQFVITHTRLADVWQREHHILQTHERRELQLKQRRYIDRWVTCLDGCYPGHGRAELLAVIRGLHALITSDTTRRSASPPPTDLAGLLTNLAWSAAQALAN